ncbi:MAG: hypothetical protein ABMA00_03025 [Gemmatimonas sp.]
MSHLIDVSSVLRGTVCDLYSNLVTRPTGAAVRTAIEQRVVEIGSPVVTTIDFSQVNLLDFSCADEIVAKLLLRYAQTDGLAGYLLFRGIEGEHLDPIETVLERHDLALVAWHEGLAELYGCVSAEERWLWELVRDVGPIGVRVASETMGTTADDTEALLERLFQRRLIMHHDSGYVVPGTLLRAS